MALDVITHFLKLFIALFREKKNIQLGSIYSDFVIVCSIFVFFRTAKEISPAGSVYMLTL